MNDKLPGPFGDADQWSYKGPADDQMRFTADSIELAVDGLDGKTLSSDEHQARVHEMRVNEMRAETGNVLEEQAA